MAQIQALPFPGNIRELKNVVWQLASESGQTTGKITSQLLPPEIAQTLDTSASPAATSPPVASAPASLAAWPQKTVPETEDEQQWRTFCEQHQGDVYAMASALGVHRTTVIRKLKKYGLSYARKPRARRAVPKTVSQTMSGDQL